MMFAARDEQGTGRLGSKNSAMENPLRTEADLWREPGKMKTTHEDRRVTALFLSEELVPRLGLEPRTN